MKKHINYLEKLNACNEAVIWAEQFNSMQEAWDNCERGNYMLWLLGSQSGPPESKSRKRLVLTVCKCARLSLKHVPKDEKRPLKAIQTAEKYAKGVKGVTLQDVKNAAADAAGARVAHVAAYAADAAATGAYATYAADAAATGAAYAAAAAACAAGARAGDAAADAADIKTLKRCAEIVRKDYPKIKMI